MTAPTQLTNEIIALYTAHHIFQTDKTIHDNMEGINQVFAVPKLNVLTNSEQLSILPQQIPFMCLNCAKQVGTTQVPTFYRCGYCPNRRDKTTHTDFTLMRYGVQYPMLIAGYSHAHVDYFIALYIASISAGMINLDDWIKYVRDKINQTPNFSTIVAEDRYSTLDELAGE